MAVAGVVVIGRNEGARLERCLASVEGAAARVVYVDSGSTDASVRMARARGAEVLELDLRTPFTAARARNEGFRRLRELAPRLEYVQFVDGDCELIGGWLQKAAAFLGQRGDVAAVCGRLRERHPERTVYNMLCDIEWDWPAGESRACGGIAMLRADAFEAVRGFRGELIAGEEPELCVRLRTAGWRIWRLADEMALHDAALSRFGQWWTRTLRGGYAFAQGAALHGAAPERHCVRESRSIWLWGLGMPAAILGLALAYGPWACALLLVYPAQVVRLAVGGRRSPRENWWRAGFVVLGKFPELIGQLRFRLEQLRGARSRLIEHK